jgi:hypothetical protein
MDRYWDVLAEMFTFNLGACCQDTPLRNETMLHVRGFDVEQPKCYEKKGWRELNANRIYDELLYHLKGGDCRSFSRKSFKFYLHTPRSWN